MLPTAIPRGTPTGLSKLPTNSAVASELITYCAVGNSRVGVNNISSLIGLVESQCRENPPLSSHWSALYPPVSNPPLHRQHSLSSRSLSCSPYRRLCFVIVSVSRNEFLSIVYDVCRKRNENGIMYILAIH